MPQLTVSWTNFDSLCFPKNRNSLFHRTSWLLVPLAVVYRLLPGDRFIFDPFPLVAEQSPSMPTEPLGHAFAGEDIEQVQTAYSWRPREDTVSPTTRLGSHYETSASPMSSLSDDQSGFLERPPQQAKQHSTTQISTSVYDISLLTGVYLSAFQKALEAGPTATNYHNILYFFLAELQKQGDPPKRPPSARMEEFFEGVPLPSRVNGKGSKGGMERHNCRWPECTYYGPLQKCMDHFFSAHVKLKFFSCDFPTCDRVFTRKYDLDKHKKKIHGVERPRGSGKRAHSEEEEQSPSLPSRTKRQRRY
ncbi:hypothetical protein FS842_002229 [Serendipita sp. 407]|nr:hypothetical protein FS842_002229 [Serendipita sp. 407]